MVDPDAALPLVAPAPEPVASAAGPGRRHNPRRERPA
jgi:hypothetical protein